MTVTVMEILWIVFLFFFVPHTNNNHAYDKDGHVQIKKLSI